MKTACTGVSRAWMGGRGLKRRIDPAGCEPDLGVMSFAGRAQPAFPRDRLAPSTRSPLRREVRTGQSTSCVFAPAIGRRGSPALRCLAGRPNGCRFAIEVKAGSAEEEGIRFVPFPPGVSPLPGQPGPSPSVFDARPVLGSRTDHPNGHRRWPTLVLSLLSFGPLLIPAGDRPGRAYPPGRLPRLPGPHIRQGPVPLETRGVSVGVVEGRVRRAKGPDPLSRWCRSWGPRRSRPGPVCEPWRTRH